MIEAARPATTDDLPVIVELYRSAAEEQRNLRQTWADFDARPEPAEQSLRADLEDRDAFAVVGTIDDVPIGYAVGRLVAGLPQVGGRRLIITDIYVDPEARAVGVGELIVNELLQWGRDHDARNAEARVLPNFRDAKNFCEENGFTGRVLVMHVSI